LFGSSADGQTISIGRKDHTSSYWPILFVVLLSGLRKFRGEEKLGKAKYCVLEESSNDSVMFWGMWALRLIVI